MQAEKPHSTPNGATASGRARRRGEPDAAELDAMFREYRESGDRRLRNRLVESHLQVADYYVARFARSAGSSAEDLRQTALLAVLHAVERFDPTMGVSFKTFASRTIEGELKRYLRDRSWAVRPPRRAQELHLQVRKVAEELSHTLGRSPTVPEVAKAIGVDTDDVLEALEAGQARTATGLDAPSPGQDGASSVSRLLGALDPSFGSVEERMVLRGAVEELGERERLVLRLRFVDELSQPEIAEEIGVSQSYVSRIIRGCLTQLREALATPESIP